ncbi:MAG: dihydroneopterin aldolase [Bacteroidaceae bacterium]|nr:dihydroneopterin aldolase [Bacteroidaceae bacterium]
MKYTLSEAQIELRGLTFFAYHGVLPEERQNGNTFVVDLVLDADISRAVCTDELDDTVNYAAAYEVVKREMAVPSLLLEHVCGRIATALLDAFSALSRVQVTVTKKNPPIEGAGVCESAVKLVLTREVKN